MKKIYCQVIDGVIKQIADGFNEPPFENAVLVDDNVPLKPNCWRYVDGEIVYIESISEPEPIPQPPTEQEILWQTITDLQIDLMATNQSLTDAQLEIEILKGGI